LRAERHHDPQQGGNQAAFDRSDNGRANGLAPRQPTWITLWISMVVLRCAQRLLHRLKRFDDDVSASSDTRLGNWYGNLIRIGRRHVLLFISEHSRLPVLLPVRQADHLASAFPAAVCDMLAAVGVPPAAVERERQLMSPLAFDRTRSRSLIGSLTDFTLMTNARFITHSDQSLESIALELAETPLKYKHPSAVAQRLFGID